jgi:hypothetical protein
MSTSNPSGNLLANLLLFGRLLRRLGLEVKAGRMLNLMQALQHISIGHKHDFYHAAASLLVHRREDLPRFEQAFNLFWRKHTEEWTTLNLHELENELRLQKRLVNHQPFYHACLSYSQNPKAAAEEAPRPLVQQTYSDIETLRRRDFAEMNLDKLRRAKEMIAELAWNLGERRTRRRQPGGGRFLDWRHTLRRNLKYGGEVLNWARRELKFKPRPLVVIADISGSMERYTNLLLQFIYSLSSGLNKVEAFVFSTRLTRISKQLHYRDAERALKEVEHCVSDWAGGTRIGETLKDFNFKWGRRVLSRGARGHDHQRRLGSRRYSVVAPRNEKVVVEQPSAIWLNPLLGHEGYEPLTQGMSAALPYIDDFLPVHNLVSLEQVGEVLFRRVFRRGRRFKISNCFEFLRRGKCKICFPNCNAGASAARRLRWQRW